MMQLHKIFENPKKAFCFFCFAIIILFAAYRSVNGFFYGGGYQWQETRQTANMAEEVSLSELYGADYEIYPFGVNDSTAAVFCTESIGDTMKEEKSFLRKIVLYSMKSGENIQEILLDHRYFSCSICDYEGGTDILFYTQNRLGQNCLLWFRWDKQKNQMTQILEKTIEDPFSDYTLIAEGKSAALISYSAEKNELQSISEEGARPFLKLVGNEIVDLQVESNGTDILVMEKLAEKAQFRIYRNGRSFRSRPLAENEDCYSMHLLKNGALLYLQIEDAEISGKRLVWWPYQGNEATIVWWPYQGDEVTISTGMLYRGISDHQDTALWNEFSQSGAKLHRVYMDGKKCIHEVLDLEADYAALPQITLYDRKSRTANIFLNDVQKMGIIPLS